MPEYKFYENTDFSIADGPIEIDLLADIGGERVNAVIMCDDKSIDVEIDHNGVYGEKITLYETDKLEDGKVAKLRISTTENNAAYRVIAGIKS